MESSILKNKEHYNNLYGKVCIKNIVDKALNFEAFLDDAIKTDTSWHGMYHGDFRNILWINQIKFVQSVV
jgi:hypothetical protein